MYKNKNAHNYNHTTQKLIILEKQQNYTHDINYQKLFLSFRTTTGELFTQEYQTICSSIVMSIVRLTRSLG